jgi:hypothetical protein
MKGQSNLWSIVFIRDKILNKDISTPSMAFGDQLDDMFTKSLC